MHGLIRVRQFTLSDGHIVCTPDQIEDEFRRCLDLSYYFLDCLGLKDDVTFRFSKRGKSDKAKYIDNDKAWQETEARMKTILDDLGIDYVEADGEAAFYGLQPVDSDLHAFAAHQSLLKAYEKLQRAKAAFWAK